MLELEKDRVLCYALHKRSFVVLSDVPKLSSVPESLCSTDEHLINDQVASNQVILISVANDRKTGNQQNESKSFPRRISLTT